MPQGRVQPYYITVSAAGVVTWRVQFRSDFYTSLDVQAFPFDSQRLEVLLQLLNLNPERGRVKVRRGVSGFLGEGVEEVIRKHKNFLPFQLLSQTHSSLPLSFCLSKQQVTPSARGLHLFTLGYALLEGMEHGKTNEGLLKTQEEEKLTSFSPLGSFLQ
jgi:hypothetical protein